ncbi:barstar family protein [Bernardetia sp. Wsw4-3y2]|uniref:barstar family protein n=1 Tax=Bernardetia sp. Wsw4-3y2 TaxID=3127471 RepID=UPI0030D1E6D6
MQYIEKIKDKEYFVTELNSSKFKSYKNLIEEFSLAFSIPSIVSNLDALDDYLTHLEWIEQKNYKLIIKNMNKVEKNKNDYKQFFSIIEGLENHWKTKENDFIVEYVGNS